LAQTHRKSVAEEDRIIAAVQNARDFVIERRAAFLLGLAAVIVIIVVSTLVVNSRAKARLEIESQIAEAVFLMQGMDHQRAALILESVLERRPGGDLGQDIRYHLATAQYLTENYRRALELFNEILAANPEDPLRRFTAREGIAHSYEAQGDFAQAAEQYEKIAPEAPEKERIPMVLAQAVRCYENAGNLAAARRLAERLRDEFGDENDGWKREGTRLVARLSVLQAPEGE